MSGFVSGFGNKKIENKSIDYSRVVVSSDNIRVYSNSVLTNDDGVEEVYLDPNVVPDNFIGPLAPGQRRESDQPPSINVPSNEWIFGDKALETGQFGGNQGSLWSKKEKYLNDPKIKEIIAKYYSDVSSEDMELLFDRMNRVGCGYIAGINTILLEYIFNSESDFMERFGYSPYELVYDENGKLYKEFNYDYLFLDYFLYYAKTEGYETIDEVYGNILEERIDSSSQDGAISGRKFSRTGMSGTSLEHGAEIAQSFLDEKGIKMSFTNYPKIELEIGSDEWKKLKAELESKGLQINDDEKLYKSFDCGEDFQKIFNEGKQIVVSAASFTMYSDKDIDGNYKYDDVLATDVGSHAMYYVGSTSDPNKIVVSSWGNRYIIDISDINGYVVYDYHR